MPKKAFTTEQIKTLREHYAKRELDTLLLHIGPDTLLRAGDLLQLNVGDVIRNGKALETVRVTQKKTGKKTLPMPLSELTRMKVEYWLWNVPPERPLLLSQRRTISRISDRGLRKTIDKWCRVLGVRPDDYGVHSLRKALPTMIYQETRDIESVRRLLGHQNVTATSAYLGIDDTMALDLARQYQIV